MQPRKQANSPIHYTWVGPPSAHDQTGVAGHDVACVINMAQALPDGRQISFWCLADNLSYYKELLLQFPNINVQSIESFVATHTQETVSDQVAGNPAADMQAMMKLLLASDTNTIRDRVAVKNLFSIYLLMEKGGYCLDTNVEPLQGQLLKLDGAAQFTIAGFNVFDKPSIIMEECFMMFSPHDSATHTAKMRDIFNLYVEEIKKAQRLRADAFTQYCKALSGGYMNAIYKQDPALFPGVQLGDQHGSKTSVVFENGVVKHYYNTHKPKYHLSKMPFFYHAIQDRNYDRVQAMLRSGESVNQTLHKPIKHQDKTPLHWAVWRYSLLKDDKKIHMMTEIIVSLIAAGAKVDVKANHGSDRLTPIELAYRYCRKNSDGKLPSIIERTAALVKAFSDIDKVITLYRSSDSTLPVFDKIAELLNDKRLNLEAKLNGIKKIAIEWLKIPANKSQHKSILVRFFNALKEKRLCNIYTIVNQIELIKNPAELFATTAVKDAQPRSGIRQRK